MPSMFFVPLGDGRVLVHVLNYVAPTDSSIVSAKANFTFLRSVGNNAHLGAPEVVIEQILKPHSRDKQEVPTVGAALFDVLCAAVTADLPVVLSGQSKRFVELLKEVIQIELGRRHL